MRSSCINCRAISSFFTFSYLRILAFAMEKISQAKALRSAMEEPRRRLYKHVYSIRASMPSLSFLLPPPHLLLLSIVLLALHVQCLSQPKLDNSTRAIPIFGIGLANSLPRKELKQDSHPRYFFKQQAS